MLYEMLCGRPPFTGTPNAVMCQHVVDRPRPITAMYCSAPPKVGKALARSLEKSPHARYPSVGALVSALLAAAPRVRVRGQCIAVIPFTNAIDEPEVDTVSDSMSEEIAAALRDVDGLVVALDASVNATEPDRHLSHLARRAGCDAVLLGDVRESHNGTDLLVSASLYDGRSGRRIWSDVFTASRRCPLGDLSASARRVASSVAAALGIAGTGHRFTRGATDTTIVTPHGGPRMDPGERSAAR